MPSSSLKNNGVRFFLESKPKGGGSWEGSFLMATTDREALLQEKAKLEERFPFYKYRIRKVMV